VKRIVIVILILASCSLHGQYTHGQLDSLYEVYRSKKTDTAKLSMLNHFSHRMLAKDRPMAIRLAQTALKLSEKVGSKEQRATALYNYGYLMRYAGKGDSSLHYLYLAKGMFTQQKDTLSLAYAYTQLAANFNNSGDVQGTINMLDSAALYFTQKKDLENASRSLGILGNVYSMKNDYQSGLRVGLQALEIAKEIDDSTTIGRVVASLSGTYRELEDYEMSRKFYFEAIDINSRHGNQIQQFLDYKNLAAFYNEQFMYDSGLWAINKALPLLDTNARPAYYAEILASKAHNSIKLGLFAQGKEALDEVYDIAIQKGHQNLLPNVLQYYGLYYFDQGRYEEARSYYLKGLQKVKEQERFQSLKYYYIALANIAEHQGDFQEALKYKNLLIVYNDSTYMLDRAVALSNAETQFGLEKKDFKIALLNKEAEIKERKTARQRLLLIGSFCLVFLVGVLGFLGIRQSRLKQKLKMEQFRNKVAADLHDDVGSTLSSISMYSEVIKQKTKNIVPETIPMLENMSKGSQEIMDAMSDIVWTINPKNNTIQNLLSRVNKMSAELCEARGVKFNYEGNISDLKLDMEVAQNIYLVLKEAINNALKYSKCTVLSLKIMADKKELSFQVKDNGQGFDSELKSLGNGMRTMQERMNEINGTLQISSSERGTIIVGKCTQR